MERPIRVDQEANLIVESQVRECFGRVVYTHKTHEKCADRALARLSRIKLLQITLSAVTTAGLIAILVGDPDQSKLAAIVSALVSAALLALNSYTKENDLGQIAQKHKEAADKLWQIRESYFSLLSDLKAGLISHDDVRAKRDELQAKLAEVHSSAPRTDRRGYTAAAKALKVHEDLTFSEAEIDQFLPAPLRRTKQ